MKTKSQGVGERIHLSADERKFSGVEKGRGKEAHKKKLTKLGSVNGKEKTSPRQREGKKGGGGVASEKKEKSLGKSAHAEVLRGKGALDRKSLPAVQTKICPN